MDAETVLERAMAITRLLARYRNRLELSKEGLETSRKRVESELQEEDELDKMANLLIEAYETEIKDVTEAISWMEDTNVIEGKGTETGLCLKITGVRSNKAR